MALTPVLSCLCGHLKTEHLSEGAGECNEPTHRCQCGEYTELCPVCSHAQYAHNSSVDGRCTRVVIKTHTPCGCAQYTNPPEPIEGS